MGYETNKQQTAYLGYDDSPPALEDLNVQDNSDSPPGLMPTLPDILGWVVTIVIAWIIYTLFQYLLSFYGKAEAKVESVMPKVSAIISPLEKQLEKDDEQIRDRLMAIGGALKQSAAKEPVINVIKAPVLPKGESMSARFANFLKEAFRNPLKKPMIKTNNQQRTVGDSKNDGNIKRKASNTRQPKNTRSKNAAEKKEDTEKLQKELERRRNSEVQVF